MAYIDTTPIIPNTTMQIYVDGNGVQRVYKIIPVDGYVLHDSRKDFPSYDEFDDTILEGYSTFGVTVPLTYDFTANPYNLYTKLRSEVPENQIFGDNPQKPNTEVM